MIIEPGRCKYLGFLIGPITDALVNFQGPMNKLREWALFWLGCAWLGPYFQSFDFNMFCTLFLDFVSQLYILHPILPPKIC
mgnify:CR=1 FL=1